MRRILQGEFEVSQTHSAQPGDMIGRRRSAHRITHETFEMLRTFDGKGGQQTPLVSEMMRRSTMRDTGLTRESPQAQTLQACHCDDLGQGIQQRTPEIAVMVTHAPQSNLDDD